MQALSEEFNYSVKICPNTNYNIVEDKEFKIIKLEKSKINDRLDYQIIFSKRNLDYANLIKEGSVIANLKSFYCTLLL